MYKAVKPYKHRKKSIYTKKHFRRTRPLAAAAMVLAAAVLVFVGWSLEPTIQNLVTGKYRVSTPGSSSEPKSSAVSSSHSSGSSSSGTVTPVQNAVKGIYLPQSFLSNMSAIDATVSSVKQAGINLAVVELKGDNGVIDYSSKLSEAKGAGMIAPNAPDAAAAAKELAKNGIIPAAMISCFKDPVAPKTMFNAAILFAGNHSQRWLDNSGSRWLNPYNQQAQQYIIDLAKEAVSLGYTQIYLDNVEFPLYDTKAYYGDSLPSKEQALTAFIANAKTQIEAVGGKVSVIMPGVAAMGDANPQTGQDQSIYAFSADYLSPNLSPSLMGASINIGGASIAKPDLTPANTVAAAAAYLKSQAGSSLDITVPFIQAYTNTGIGGGNYKQYTPSDIGAEITALKSSGIGSFVLYSPNGVYDLSGVSSK